MSAQRIIKWSSIAIVVAFLSACVQAPKKQAFNSSANAHIKSVVIAHNINQDEYPAIVIAHPGTSFGLIGGLIAAADMQAKSTRLTQALDVSQTKFQEQFASKLKEKLEIAGYAVQVVSLKKDTKFDDALAQVRQQNTAADAIIVTEVLSRYLAAGPTSDYFPFVAAKVAKFEKSSTNAIYEDTFTYGYNAGNQQTVHLASPSEFRFSNIDILTQDVAKTRAGLLQGADAISSQISADLKK